MPNRFEMPRAAYVHVPFCRHRCGYCNFTLVTGRDDLFNDYARAIQLELQELGTPHQVDTLFFGGGTPTHLPPDRLRRLIELVGDWFPLAENYEFTVEANPADLDEEMSEMLASLGVNRLSLGGQSFDAKKLAVLERDHSPEQLCTVVGVAQKHIASLSLDLIFGVPGETLDVWQRDLLTARALGMNHISTYGLTIERGTSFGARMARGELNCVDEELQRAMYLTAIDLLESAGLEHYEVSNFARPGKRCRHNETYWSGAGYFAVGPGAARYVNGRREMNYRSTTTYLKKVLAGYSPVFETETLSDLERARETLVFGLRRMEGIERVTFQNQTGFSIDAVAGDVINRFKGLHLLADDGRRIRLTRDGLLVSDALWPEFLVPVTSQHDE